MDCSYPLNSYDAHQTPVQDSNRRSVLTHSSRPNQPFSISRKPIAVNQKRDAAYTTLIDSSASGSSQSHPRTGLSRISFLRWWLPELFSSFLSVAALASTVIVLRIYDGRGLDELNLPSSLTLNGVIAAIATFNRVALMVPVGSAMSQEAWLWFSPVKQRQACRSRLEDLELSDAASRGPWGSFVFLYRARRRWLAYIGAFITIISLAFSTFVQQLLAITEFAITDPSSSLLPGSIPRAENWQYFAGNPAEIGFPLPLPLKASLYNGMLSDDITPVTASCLSGNCTWPVTPSLAVCGACSASTYHLACDDTFCNYTMPSGSVISLINPEKVSGGTGFAVVPGNGSKWDFNLHDKLYIANFDAVGASDRSLVQGFNASTAKASECAMWLCIQAYDVTTRATHQVQTIVHTFSYINSTPVSTSVFDNYTFPALPAEMNPTPDTDYNVSVDGWQQFSSTLIGQFNGTAMLDIESSVANGDSIDAIWTAWGNSGDLDPWIKQLALSMTNALRTFGDQGYSSYGYSQPTYPRYNGTAYQLGVSVRWSWIVLPAALVLLSVVFLVVVMIQTARSPVAAWKGSPLAILFFDVEQEIKRSILSQTDKTHRIQDTVCDARVVLRGQPGGIWTFKAA